MTATRRFPSHWELSRVCRAITFAVTATFLPGNCTYGQLRVRPRARRTAKGWHKTGAIGVPEALIDSAGKTLVARILTFSTKCLTKDPDDTCPKGCCQGSALERTRMSDSLQRISLSDGKSTLLRVSRNVVVPSGGPLTHALLDVSGGSVLESMNRGTVVHLARSKTAAGIRWAVPGGAVVEDGIVLDAHTFIVATRRRLKTPLAPRAGMLWMVSKGRLLQRKAMRIPSVVFTYMNSGTTAAMFFYDACLRGDAATCKRGRKHIRYGKGPIRPQRIRLAYSPRAKTLAVYAFGDLTTYTVKPSGLVVRATVKNAFYRDRDWFIKQGVVAMSPGGDRIAIGGVSGLVRVYDSRGKLQYNYLEPSRRAAQLWPASRTSHLAFGPQRELLVSHGATVFRVDVKGKAQRWFSLVNGKAHKPLKRLPATMKTWSIEKLETMGAYLIIVAAGRLIVFDYQTRKIHGWIGTSPGLRLGLPGLIGG